MALHPFARPLISMPGRHRPLTIGETLMLAIIGGATIGLAAATWGLDFDQITGTGDWDKGIWVRSRFPLDVMQRIDI